MSLNPERSYEGDLTGIGTTWKAHVTILQDQCPTLFHLSMFRAFDSL